MRGRFEVDPADLYAFVGPSAGPCCYEVGPEVAAQFKDGAVEIRNGKRYVDLKKANVQQLVAQGIPRDHIEVSSSCTICSGETFHSYRRDREHSGRMMAVIGLRG